MRWLPTRGLSLLTEAIAENTTEKRGAWLFAPPPVTAMPMMTMAENPPPPRRLIGRQSRRCGPPGSRLRTQRRGATRAFEGSRRHAANCTLYSGRLPREAPPLRLRFLLTTLLLLPLGGTMAASIEEELMGAQRQLSSAVCSKPPTVSRMVGALLFAFPPLIRRSFILCRQKTRRSHSHDWQCRLAPPAGAGGTQTALLLLLHGRPRREGLTATPLPPPPPLLLLFPLPSAHSLPSCRQSRRLLNWPCRLAAANCCWRLHQALMEGLLHHLPPGRTLFRFLRLTPPPAPPPSPRLPLRPLRSALKLRVRCPLRPLR